MKLVNHEFIQNNDIELSSIPCTNLSYLLLDYYCLVRSVLLRSFESESVVLGLKNLFFNYQCPGHNS